MLLTTTFREQDIFLKSNTQTFHLMTQGETDVSHRPLASFPSFEFDSFHVLEVLDALQSIDPKKNLLVLMD